MTAYDFTGDMSQVPPSDVRRAGRWLGFTAVTVILVVILAHTAAGVIPILAFFALWRAEDALTFDDEVTLLLLEG